MGIYKKRDVFDEQSTQSKMAACIINGGCTAVNL